MGDSGKRNDEVATWGERSVLTEAMMLSVKFFIMAVMSWTSFSVGWDMMSVIFCSWKNSEFVDGGLPGG